jgi:uncharacterized protein DUF4338/transposase-like protein/transposase Tn5 family protein
MIEQIQGTIDTEPDLSRVLLSRRVCDWLNWRCANGKWKEMSCRVALLKMHRRGVIRLRPLSHAAPQRKRTNLGETVKSPELIQCSLRELGAVELLRVRSADSKASRLWNELMDRYHYLSSGPLCGAQLRYLIRSGQGQCLGALAFSAAAWRVKARDQWIGWSEAARKEHLAKVVSNSRFLILPWVKVPHLASHVLSQVAQRLRADWQERYGFEPVLLESFVERGRFLGTCYRAANWQHVGKSLGRGRQDRTKSFSVPEKDVYVYPLSVKVKEILCQAQLPAEPKPSPREPNTDWAEEEFGEAKLNDERLKRRLLLIARDLYDRPQASVPEACRSRAKTKAAYRFFDHSKTTMDNLLASHYQATVKRIGQETVVLVVQDTTVLNYSAHPATEGLGPIGSKREGIVGLLLHNSMAFNLEGSPLGLLDVKCWARDPNEFQKRRLRYEFPIEEKESHKWLSAFDKVVTAQKRCPGTTLVNVADREADIYEFFHLALSDPSGPKLLVRAERDRLLAMGQGHLWEKMKEAPLAGIQLISVPRRGQRAAREARLEVRFKEVKLKPPKRKPKFGELKIWAILAEEIHAPGGVEPLKWMLLTTVPVTNFDQANEKLVWYARRWGIEVYHRTLKSGCKIEQRQLGSAERLQACLAIDMVVAWRIFHLTKLGRETPQVPCTVFFDDSQWKALCCFVHQQPTPPKEPPTLREAVRMVASLGGFLGRKGDGEPGTKSLWIGIQRLDDIEATWKFMAQNFAPHLLTPPVSSNPGYG